MTLGLAERQGDLLDDLHRFCEQALPDSSVYALLNRERDRLFPDEMFADLFSDRGRRSVPPCVVATVMVLQRLEGLSDREAVDRYAFDARWRYAAGVGGYDGDGWAQFAHTVLVDLRARLAASTDPRRIFRVALDAAAAAGLVGIKRVLDSTPLYDAVATMDTITLIRSATSRRVSFKIFEGETARTYATGAERPGFESLSLSERLQRVVRLLSESYMTPVLVIIDELDRLRDKSGLGSLIKALSTEDLKFLLVGIAQDWSELLIDHASVERPITPIRLPRMKRAELAEIVDLAARSLAEAGSSISCNMEARTRLVDVASGFPWFVHVLGQAALMACVDDQKEVVTRDDVIRATRRLIDNSYAHLFADSYQRAVRDSAQRETTLRVLAAWKGADIPTAAAYPILKKLGVSNPTAYKGALRT